MMKSENEPASAQTQQDVIVANTLVPQQLLPESTTLNAENGQDESMSAKPAEIPSQNLLHLGGDSPVAYPSLMDSHQVSTNPPAPAANGDVDLLFLGSGDNHGDSADPQPKIDYPFSSFPAGESQPIVTTQPTTSPFGDLLPLETDNNKDAVSVPGNLLDPSALAETSHQPHSGEPILAQPTEPLNIPSPTATAQEDSLLPQVAKDHAESSGHETGDNTAKEQSANLDLLSLGQSAEHEGTIAKEPNEVFQPSAEALPSEPGESEPPLPDKTDASAVRRTNTEDESLPEPREETRLPAESPAPSEGAQWLNPKQHETLTTTTTTSSGFSPAENPAPSQDMPPSDENIETAIESGTSSNTAIPDGPTSGSQIVATGAQESTDVKASEPSEAIKTVSSEIEDIPASTTDDGISSNTTNDGSGMSKTSSEPVASIEEPPSTTSTPVASSQPTSVPPSTAEVKGTDTAAPPCKENSMGTKDMVPSTPAPSKVSQRKTDTPLPQQVKWLEQELHAAHTLIMKLQQQQGEDEATHDESKRESNTIMVDLQANLQSQMSKRAEAEDAARLAKAKTEKLEKEVKTIKEEMETKVEELNKNLMTALEEKSSLATELKRTQEERDEKARKEASLVNRLNAAKKKEAAKANAAEHYEEQVESLQNQVTQLQGDLTSVTEEKSSIQQQFVQLQKSSQQRIQQLDSALTEERRLNDERKRKMKGFVEAKVEEIRSSKETHVSLQTELDQTNRSLMELNQRWKQLHAQWVQSQTRNRELQRDMNKMKKDSEKMHTVGDTLQMKLSRSALETEEHKNKRLTAKNELMSVLRQLEAERDLTNRLRDSIKFTFTPKAISQQQIIQETLGEFENELQRLARRLGRPLTPPDDSMIDTVGEAPLDTTESSDNPEDGDLNLDPGRPSFAEANTARLLSKLESETQRVSQCIMSFSANVERMHTVLAGPGTRNCVSVLQDLLASSGRGGTEPSNEETAAMTSGTRRSAGATRYGQVAGSIT